MSYCRRNLTDCDVYLYWSDGDFIQCSGCEFDDPWILNLHSVDEVIEHIAKHRAAGHKVPEGLETDVKMDNPWTGNSYGTFNWWACPDCRMILDRDGPPAGVGPYTCQHCGKEWK